MQECLLALGSNLSDSRLTPFEMIEKLFDLILSESVAGVKKSAIYRSPAFPAGSGPDYANAAMELHTYLPANALLERLHAIEEKMGRTRNKRWEARLCDIDLIAYGDEIAPDLATYQRWADLPLDAQMEEMPDQLILPHPRMAERGFVLLPLMDVAPDWVHPVTGLSVRQMLEALPAEALEGVVQQ